MDTFLKNVAQIEPKFPFKAVYFLGVRGLTPSSYIVYGYTASGHTDFQTEYVLFTIYTFIYTIISSTVKMGLHP